MSDEIKLGDVVQDKVTGFEGTVMGIINYLNGCVQCQIQPKVKEDGTWGESHWIDHPQLILMTDNGGDQSEPTHGGERSHP